MPDGLPEPSRQDRVPEVADEQGWQGASHRHSRSVRSFGQQDTPAHCPDHELCGDHEQDQAEHGQVSRGDDLDGGADVHREDHDGDGDDTDGQAQQPPAPIA